MTSDNDIPAEPPAPFRLPALWDVCVPVAIAAVPMGIYRLIGFLGRNLDEVGGAKQPEWMLVLFAVLSVIGNFAMAALILTRFDNGRHQLVLRTNGHPPVWRKRVLVIAMACILLFDILTNLAAAFPEAWGFLVAAGPMLVLYLVFMRIAFAGLERDR